MTTPALRALKEGPASPKITLLTSPVGASVAALVPEIDEVLIYEAPWMKATTPRQQPAVDFEIIARLQQGGYDAGVVFTVFSQNPLPAALYLYLAQVPLRLAYCRENPYQLLTDWVPDPAPRDEGHIPHEVRRLLDLVAEVGAFPSHQRLSLRTPPGAADRVLSFLREQGIDLAAPWFLIHPGASAPSRRYSPQHFSQVIRCLALQHGVQIVLSGTAAEAGLVAKIQAGAGVPLISTAGRFNLGEFAALIELAPLLISNNTGPVHMAAALGTPVVDLYALTNPQHTPWNVPHRLLFQDVPCKYCYKSECPLQHHNCLRLVHPQAVASAALGLFQEQAGALKAGVSL